MLAIPTLAGASLYDLIQSRDILTRNDAGFFAIGLVTSFLVALAVVRWLMGYVKGHDFQPFAIWRLLLGASVLLLGFEVTDS